MTGKVYLFLFLILFKFMFISHQTNGSKNKRLVIIDQFTMPEPEPRYNPPKDSPFIDLFRSYPSYKKIESYLLYLRDRYPDRVKIENVGRSVGNNTIFVVTAGANIKNNYNIFIDAGIHGREWLPIMLALYIIYALVEVTLEEPIKNYQWVIVPVANPDSYEYSFKNESWRKNINFNNCNKNLCKPSETCGVDIFQNFRFSKNVENISRCSTFYGGEQNVTERETEVMKSLLKQFSPYMQLYLGLHSFGSYILTPCSRTGKLCRYEEPLIYLASRIKYTLNIHLNNKLKYRIGNYASSLYITYGTLLDYVTSELKVKHAFILLLRKSETTHDDPYHPPESQIIPMVQETFLGIRAMVDEIYETYPPPKEILRIWKGIRRRKNKCDRVKINLFIFLSIIAIGIYL